MSLVRWLSGTTQSARHSRRQPVIESITSIREPQPEFEAIYILMPTTQNVERIIKDFSNHKQYAAAHLFFTEGARVLPGFHSCYN
jgi:hypothetical protein